MNLSHSEGLTDLAQALTKAQSQVRAAAKDSTNPFFKSKYADLASVWEACRDALHENGLSVTQFPGYEDSNPGSPGIATVTTILLHTSGQWIKGTAGAPLKTADAQGVGSAITYLRRYALAAVVGVVQEDDDGEGTMTRKPAPRGKVTTPQLVTVAPTWKGKPLSTFASSELVSLRAWCFKTDMTRFAPDIEAIDELLALREGA